MKKMLILTTLSLITVQVFGNYEIPKKKFDWCFNQNDPDKELYSDYYTPETCKKTFISIMREFANKKPITIDCPKKIRRPHNLFNHMMLATLEHQLDKREKKNVDNFEAFSNKTGLPKNIWHTQAMLGYSCPQTDTKDNPYELIDNEDCKRCTSLDLAKYAVKQYKDILSQLRSYLKEEVKNGIDKNDTKYKKYKKVERRLEEECKKRKTFLPNFKATIEKQWGKEKAKNQ
ncbi:MAG TPA: hypothetical protein ENI08_00680 [Candidatus Dependentiae bacterium]|nr:hypothetical protein [Candidatus Dependentiae bacterium]